MRDYVNRSLLEEGLWNLDGSEDLSSWEGNGTIFIKHITPKGLAMEMCWAGDLYHTSIYRSVGNIPYWLSGRLPEEYKQTKYFPDHDPFDDVVCLD